MVSTWSFTTQHCVAVISQKKKKIKNTVICFKNERNVCTSSLWDVPESLFEKGCFQSSWYRVSVQMMATSPLLQCWGLTHFLHCDRDARSEPHRSAGGAREAPKGRWGQLQFTSRTSSYVVVLSQQQKKEHGDVSRPLNFPEFGASVHSAMKACRSVMWMGSWVWCLIVS